MKVFKYFFLFCIFFKFSYGIYQNTNSEKMKAESEVVLKGSIIEIKGIEEKITPKIELDILEEGTDIRLLFNHDDVELISEPNDLIDINISKFKEDSSKSIFNINFIGKKLKDSEIEILKSGKSVGKETPDNEKMKIIKLTAIYR